MVRLGPPPGHAAITGPARRPPAFPIAASSWVARRPRWWCCDMRIWRETTRRGLLATLRRGETIHPDSARDLLQALVDLEAELRDAPQLDRKLSYALAPAGRSKARCF